MALRTWTSRESHKIKNRKYDMQLKKDTLCRTEEQWKDELHLITRLLMSMFVKIHES